MSEMQAPEIIEFPQDAPQPVPGKATLYAKLARVMGKINRIAKSGYNEHFKYPFATDADIADAVRGALAEEKVAFLVNMLEPKREGNKVTVPFEFTFACGDTGATITKTWEGEAIDGQDKGISKAATSAEKYFLMKTFLISSGKPEDDADAGPAPESAAKKKNQQQRRIDTTEKPAPNGRKQSLRQQLVQTVKHPYYNSEEHLNNALTKLFQADILHDGMELDKAVAIVKSLATYRENGTEPDEAIEAVRKDAAKADTPDGDGSA
jgi:hypothetical protein